MPPERHKRTKRHHHRQSRELVIIGIITFVVLVAVFGLFYAMTSARFR